MGLFDRVRGGADSTLSFDVQPAEVAPGGQVVVRFQVGGGEPARAVQLTFEGAANYQAKVTRTYGAGDDTNTATTEEWQNYSLHQEEREVPAAGGSGEAAFTVPRNAPPSSSGAVTWTVKGRVVRDGGKEKAVRATVAVRNGAENLPARTSPAEHDGLTLELPAGVRAGDTLSGRLDVAVGKDITARAVRIELYRSVTYTASPMDDGTIYGSGAVPFTGKGQIRSETKVVEAEVSGKRDFSAGSVEQVPFSVQIPATAGPTTAHAYARVEWRLVAVVDRKMRSDFSVESPLAVL